MLEVAKKVKVKVLVAVRMGGLIHVGWMRDDFATSQKRSNACAFVNAAKRAFIDN